MRTWDLNRKTCYDEGRKGSKYWTLYIHENKKDEFTKLIVEKTKKLIKNYKIQN